MAFGEPGGRLINEAVMKQDIVRAELVEVINVACLQHAAQIADVILAHYKVTRRGSTTKRWKEKP